MLLRYLTIAPFAAAALMSFAPARAEEPPAAPPPTVEEPQAKPAPAPQPPPVVTAGKEGFSLKSADGAWIFRLRGYIQFDGRFIDNEGASPGTDTFLIRRARPIFEGTLGGRFDWRIMADFGDGKTILYDGYVDARLSSSTTLRLGKFKPPFDLGRLQSATDLPLVERALTTNLVPNRDVGIMDHGELATGLFACQLGIFNGVADGATADVDTNDGKDTIGRVFVKPFRNGPFKRLGIGVAGSTGTLKGDTSSTGLNAYKTEALQDFFSWRTGTSAATTTLADGRRERWSPQAWLGIGRFGLLAEHVTERMAVTLGASSDTIDIAAWQATATFVLTGEDASYRGIVPRRPLGQGSGAWELVARAGALSIDGEAFPTYADPTVSARRAQEIALGLNDMLTTNIRVMTEVVRTTFTGGATGGDRDTELAGLMRFQISF